MNDIDWRYSAFPELSPLAVYEILALRQRVFIIEQRCLFLDADGYDPAARHLTGRREDRLLAYARVLPPGVKHAEYAIGRLVVEPRARNRGLGRAAMREAIRRIVTAAGPVPIRLQAQDHLADSFYKPLGFERIGAPYDEDGIAHVDMRLCR